MSLDVELKKKLEEKQKSDLYRTRVSRLGQQDSVINIENKDFLNFCSNDYLGLANHPEIVGAIKLGLDQYGVGSGGSSLVTGHSLAHQELEKSLAEYTGRSRALLFSSGYAANVGILSALIHNKTALFMDKLCHASLIDGAKLSGAEISRYLHLDMISLEKKLSSSSAEKESWVITESLFSMDGDIAPLRKIFDLCKKSTTNMYVDDAHGMGIFGENGAGSLNAENLSEKEVPILVATFGKAFGAAGAFVAGSEALIENLIQNSRSYIYTTAMPSALACGILKSLDLVKTQNWRREKLFSNIEQFRSLAEESGIPLSEKATGPIQPIIIGDSMKAVQISQMLAKRGIKITAIRAPTVAKNKARLRITLSAAQDFKQIETVVDSLSEVLDYEA